jgi:hypothetical protein
MWYPFLVSILGICYSKVCSAALKCTAKCYKSHIRKSTVSIIQYKHKPFWSTGWLHQWCHAIAVQRFGLAEVDNVENNSLKNKFAWMWCASQTGTRTRITCKLTFEMNSMSIIHTHTWTHIFTYTLTHIFTHTHTHTQTHIHAHSHTSL